MPNSYFVYKHTSPSGKVYIGITRQEPEKRWKRGKGYRESHNLYFYNAIVKYGWDAFQHEILYHGLTKDEACALEIALIEQYKSTNHAFGYNLSPGGDAPCPTERTREKISDALKEKWSDEAYKKTISASMRGKTRSEQARENISRAQKARFSNPQERIRISERQYGKQRTEEAKKKTSQSLLAYYSDPDNLAKLRAIRAASDGKGHNHPVICVDTGIRYKSLKDAAAATNGNRQNIAKCCQGERKTAGGYHWRYIKED